MDTKRRSKNTTELLADVADVFVNSQPVISRLVHQGSSSLMVWSKVRRALRACLFLLTAICLMGAGGLVAVAQSPVGQRPNIVLILCDDLGYADVGFNGATDIVTPHLDALASNGKVFSSAYVCHPFCGPSRMGLMTGRYPHVFGAPFNLPNSGLGIEEYNRLGVPVSQRLLSSQLQKAGYFTGAIGKWHLGIQPEFHPNRRGFDEFYGFLGGGHMYFPEKFGPIYERQKRGGKETFNEYIVPLERNGQPVEETEYVTDGLSREAVRFVHNAASKDAPFFLYLAYNAPHTPLEAKEDDLARFAEISDDKRRTYAAMVYAVDRGVGQVVSALKETQTFEETLIVFLSDNGGKIGGGSDNGPLAQGKGSICEGGIRVPMFFHWPKVVSQGRYDFPVTALDFYPTFSALAGLAPSDSVTLDGLNIWDCVQANQSPDRREPIFALRHWNGFHNVGARQGDWKVTKRGPKSAWNLFDVAKDPGEQTDLADQHPDIVKRIVEAAGKWSQTHIQPAWFDNKSAEERWNKKQMPVYKSTFSLP